MLTVQATLNKIKNIKKNHFLIHKKTLEIIVRAT